MEPGIVFQIGTAPRRIVILTRIVEVEFVAAYEDKETFELEELLVPFLSKEHLIKNKESTRKEQDKLDARQLKKHSGQQDEFISPGCLPP